MKNELKTLDFRKPLTELESVACAVMLPEADMMEWQLDYIALDAPVSVCSKHRQGGATKKVWTIRIMLHSLKLAAMGAKGENWYWVSRDIFTAREFIQEFRSMWEPLGLISKENKGIGIMRIRLPCGGWLNAMSSSPNALAGKTGNIVFDEFAIHNDQEQLWSIGAPGANWGFSISALSTPRGKATLHARMVQEIKDGKNSAHLLEIDLLKSISQGLVRIINRARAQKGEEPLTDEEFIKQCKEKSSSEELFLQEYMCTPSNGNSASVITGDDMKGIMMPPPSIGCVSWNGEGKMPLPPRGEIYAGGDIGNKRDLTVFWFCELLSTGQLVTKLIVTLPPGQSFEKKEAIITPLLKTWRPRRALVDATNCPDFVERLKKKYPLVEPFLFTSKSRKATLSYAIEQVKRKQILVPALNEIGKDFCSVESWVDMQGNRDYWIPSRKEEGHGDRFMAAALCMDAARERARALQLRHIRPVAKVAPVVKVAAASPRRRSGGGF